MDAGPQNYRAVSTTFPDHRPPPAFALAGGPLFPPLPPLSDRARLLPLEPISIVGGAHGAPPKGTGPKTLSTII